MEEWIKKSDAIEAINKSFDKETLLKCFVRKIAIDAIIQVPSADRPRGEWRVRGNPKRNLWECSLCRCTIYSESESDRNEFHKWCGRCGARMKGADDEDN